MSICVKPTVYRDVEPMRELFRHEANCQIVHDSALARGLADPYLIQLDGRTVGYGAVWNAYMAGRLTEFYVIPEARSEALPLFRGLLAVSQATQIEAQTNLPLMLTMLYDCARNIVDEKILFADSTVTRLTCPDGVFRHAAPADDAAIFRHQHEPVGEWVVESGGEIVATGGFYCHYNPPYGDIFMEVSEPARRRGVGSYLVQELKCCAYEAGKRPSARCDPDNVASRRTLQKAGFLPCARLLVGDVGPASPLE